MKNIKTMSTQEVQNRYLSSGASGGSQKEMSLTLFRKRDTAKYAASTSVKVVMETNLDHALKTLIRLLDEMDEKNFSSILKDVHGELQTNPGKKRVSALRVELRSLLVDRPGGFMELYIPDDGKKTQELIDATNVVKSFARRRFMEFIIPPPKI